MNVLVTYYRSAFRRERESHDRTRERLRGYAQAHAAALVEVEKWRTRYEEAAERLSAYEFFDVTVPKEWTE